MFAIKALSNCNLLVLQREAFFELLKEYPWVSQQSPCTESAVSKVV